MKVFYETEVLFEPGSEAWILAIRNIENSEVVPGLANVQRVTLVQAVYDAIMGKEWE